MAELNSMDLVALVRAHLEEQCPDVLRTFAKTLAETVTPAEDGSDDHVCRVSVEDLGSVVEDHGGERIDAASLDWVS